MLFMNKLLMSSCNLWIHCKIIPLCSCQQKCICFQQLGAEPLAGVGQGLNVMANNGYSVHGILI